MKTAKQKIALRQSADISGGSQFGPDLAGGILSRLGIRHVQKRCPHCDSIVYSRRHQLCGVCGEDLPGGCQFSPAEAQRIEEVLAADRQRYRAWLKRSTAP